MRTLSPALLLLLAACGKPAAQPGGPQEVARAAFEALKAGELGPLEPHLMTPEEARKVMTVALDDSALRERWQALVAENHERLAVDWETATLASTRVRMDPMGGRAKVRLEIRSGEGAAAVEIEVLKIGRRFVFQDLTHVKPAPEKQAAPAEGEPGD